MGIKVSDDDNRRDEVLSRMLRTPPAPRRQDRAPSPARKPKPRKSTDEALDDLVKAIKGQSDSPR
jgi:hypothetical protein